VVDVSGLYAAPGLINSHVHVATPPNRSYALAMLRRAVFGGITTVRDMADDLREVSVLANKAADGEIPSPNIYYAALVAGPEFFDDPRTHEASKGVTAGEAPWMQAVGPAADIRQAVTRAAGVGATAVKIYADLPADRVAAITREAHRQHLLVWAHAAVFPASPAEVIDAGVDSVSHVCMLAYQASKTMPGAYAHRAPVEADRFAAGDNPIVQRLFDRIRQHGTILDATLWVYDEMAADHSAHPETPPPYCAPELAQRLARQAYRSGDLIATGTDGFSPWSDPWPALQDEMILLQDKAGMKPIDVLRSATLTGAKAVGLPYDTGVIAPGMLADMVFVSQNPLVDVRAFKQVVLTVKRGRQYWRKDYPPVTEAEWNGGE
jgi:imidazolonepropionase-like amidohydrolase